MDRFTRVLVEFSARVIYNVVTRHISHDRAFQSVLRENRKAAQIVPLRVLYRVSHDIVSDYYTIRFLDRLVYGGQGGGAKRLAKLWLLYRGLESEHLARYVSNVERLRRKLLKSLPRRVESLEEALDTIEDPVERMAVELSYPLWFVKTMVTLLGFDEARRLLEALNAEKWWIRVNTLKTDVDTVAERLLEKGVIVRRDPDLEYMLEVVDFNEPLHHLEEMWRGEIVFQDKASAMVVEALNPEPGDTILDMAAAPGVKDTLIMQLTDNKATIVAVDVSWERLKRARRVMKLYGVDLTRVELVHADSSTLTIRRRVDKVILDAPCTSSGAIGKDPAIKIHLEDPGWVQRFPELQARMLENSLRVPGRPEMVYAVCSLLHFEGEEQVSRIASRVELVEPGIRGAPGYSRYTGISSSVKRFFPHLHGTQGFFISRLKVAGGNS